MRPDESNSSSELYYSILTGDYDQFYNELKKPLDLNSYIKRQIFDFVACESDHFENLSPLEFLASQPHTRKEQILKICEMGADVFRVNPETNSSAYEHAIIFGVKTTVDVLLDLRNAKCPEIDLQDNVGDTALHRAVKDGNQQLVEELLSNGANISTKNIKGETPLLLAYLLGHKKIQNWFLEKGVEQAYFEDHLSGVEKLSSAVRLGHLGSVMALIDHKKEFKKDEFGRTLAAIAIECGHPHVILFLIKNRISILGLYSAYGARSLWLSGLLIGNEIKRLKTTNTADISEEIHDISKKFNRLAGFVNALEFNNSDEEVYLANIALRLSRCSPAWKFSSLTVPVEMLDRRKTLFYGPLFCSEKHPWPITNDGLPAEPIMQIDLREVSEFSGVDFGKSLLQLWMDGIDGVLREIPHSEVESEHLADIPDVSSTNFFDASWVGPTKTVTDWIHPTAEQVFGVMSPNFTSSNVEDDLLDISERFESGSIAHELCDEVSAIASRTKPYANTLFGTFVEIQYNCTSVPKALICLNGDGMSEWGDAGSAQIFYEFKENNRPEFSFSWSCY